ncbi:hypothetical protein TUM4438_41270 [Shewanella sairae]|uniref:DUF904 domain-containing protein n=1 Tax=Shewanella sairae TaxID=190310 RepID=A0ABQ4PRX7_9GAMM|nr:hypothetical protein [Shewanella sairae]MCL1132718.1 hypothetical protein [Shewanella sairae]GIU51482.1 hypothetical protein TUM4438_41270 [Shewanella sairae]
MSDFFDVQTHAQNLKVAALELELKIIELQSFQERVTTLLKNSNTEKDEFKELNIERQTQMEVLNKMVEGLKLDITTIGRLTHVNSSQCSTS